MSELSIQDCARRWSLMLLENGMADKCCIAHNDDTIFCFESVRGLANRRKRPDWIPEQFKVEFKYVGRIKPL